MPVTLVHGTADDVVPISEGEDARDLWAEVDGCSAPTTDADGCTVASCDAGATVRFCAAEGVGHVLIYAQYDTADRIRERVAGTASR
jgi:poly(3-hydroxybutyrate) depolymerase